MRTELSLLVFSSLALSVHAHTTDGFHTHTHFSGPHTGRVRPGSIPQPWGLRQELPSLPLGAIPELQESQPLNPVRRSELAWPILDYSPNLNIPGRSWPLQQPAFTDGNGRWNDGHLGQAFGQAQRKRFLDPLEAYEAAGNIRRLAGNIPHYHDKWGREVALRGKEWDPWIGRFDEQLIPEEDRKNFRDFYDPLFYPTRQVPRPGEPSAVVPPYPGFDSRRHLLSEAPTSGGGDSELPVPPPIPGEEEADFAVVDLPDGTAPIPGAAQLPDPTLRSRRIARARALLRQRRRQRQQ